MPKGYLLNIGGLSFALSPQESETYEKLLANISNAENEMKNTIFAQGLHITKDTVDSIVDGTKYGGFFGGHGALIGAGVGTADGLRKLYAYFKNPNDPRKIMIQDSEKQYRLTQLNMNDFVKNIIRTREISYGTNQQLVPEEMIANLNVDVLENGEKYKKINPNNINEDDHPKEYARVISAQKLLGGKVIGKENYTIHPTISVVDSSETAAKVEQSNKANIKLFNNGSFKNQEHSTIRSIADVQKHAFEILGNPNRPIKLIDNSKINNQTLAIAAAQVGLNSIPITGDIAGEVIDKVAPGPTDGYKSKVGEGEVSKETLEKMQSIKKTALEQFNNKKNRISDTPNPLNSKNIFPEPRKPIPSTPALNLNNVTGKDVDIGSSNTIKTLVPKIAPKPSNKNPVVRPWDITAMKKPVNIPGNDGKVPVTPNLASKISQLSSKIANNPSVAAAKTPLLKNGVLKSVARASNIVNPKADLAAKAFKFNPGVKMG